MNIRDKILVVEDEKSISGFIKAILSSNGFDVIAAHTGSEAFSMISSHCPDLLILDLGLPDMNGVAIIESCREWTRMPIIVVSARTREDDKVEALDKGADDYLTKPFYAGELLARVRVALRHSRVTATSAGRYTAGELVIDYDRHLVTKGGIPVHLTQNEYKLLTLISRNSGRILTYNYIMKELWGPQAGENNQILRVNMTNIRKKIEDNPSDPKYIFTEAGIGYRMLESD